jgi:hypothetical protein
MASGSIHNAHAVQKISAYVSPPTNGKGRNF